MEKIKKISSVIYILWLRQLKRYYRSKARMLSSLGQPILFLLAFGFGFGPVFEKAGGGDYIQFLAPGIIVMSIIFTAIFSGIEVIMDRQFGFLKETLVAPVPRWSIMIGRTLGGSTVATVQGLIVFAISILIGFNPIMSSGLFSAFIFMVLTAIIFTAIGTAIGSMLNDMHAFPMIMNFLVMPLFFLSGSIFPLEGLPTAIKIIASLNPLSYGVDGIRGALTGQLHFGYSIDLLVLSFFIVMFLGLGTYSFSKIQA